MTASEGRPRRRAPFAFSRQPSGKVQRIRRPFSPAALRLDVAAGRDHDVLHDREPEPGAARGARRVGPVEPLEEPRQGVLVDTGPVVGRRQDARVALALDGEREMGAVAGIADRVLGEVLDDHPQHPRAERQVDVAVDLDAGARSRPGGGALQVGDDLLEHGQRVRPAERRRPPCRSRAPRGTGSRRSALPRARPRPAPAPAARRRRRPAGRPSRAARGSGRAACAARATRRP